MYMWRENLFYSSEKYNIILIKKKNIAISNKQNVKKVVLLR